VKDFFGIELKEGDEVCFVDSSRSYQHLQKGNVVGFKGNKILIKTDSGWYTNGITRRESHRVVKKSS